jgi:UDP-N-acetylmuramoyl-tripeptide--D-alanyl-D-alanine ligase
MSAGFELRLSDIARAAGARLVGGDATVAGVSTDSRTLRPGELFVAIAGDHFDGHRFVADVERRGAAAVLLSREAPGLRIPQLLVPETRKAYGALGKLWRARFAAPTLALTGSNGKTTVKEMLRAILAAHAGGASAVHATEGNLNNDIGVPHTMLLQREHHRYAVFELGMNHLGEIDHLTRLVEPDVALIIMAGTAHIGELGSREAIAQAKGEIFAGLKPGGVAVINAQDRFAAYWKSLAANHRTFTFGAHDTDDLRWNPGPGPLALGHGGATVEVELALPGAHNRVNAAAAAAAALALGVPLATIAAALGACRGMPGRLTRYTGHDSATILDDTYNANAESAKAAVDVLKACAAPRIFAMGDIGEMGPHAEAAHREVGAYARDAGIEALFALGTHARHMADAFGSGARHFASHDELIDALRREARPGATILVKGSRFMKMERVVEALVPHYRGHH